MAIDVAAASKGFIALLNPGGSWDSQNNRSGGTWPGSIAAGNCYQPAVPYDGACPAIFLPLMPMEGLVLSEGAGVDRFDGTLEVYYLDRTAEQQGRTIALIEADMATNISAIIAALRADRHLGSAVGSVVWPISTHRDTEGLFREFDGSMWVWSAIRIPFIGLPA
jgi:hypothetical protein